MQQRETRPDYYGSPPTVESVRRGRIAIAALLGIAVLAGAVYLWISRDTATERWTQFPRTLSCEGDSTSLVPTAELVQGVELTHLDGQRMGMVVNFTEDPKNTVSFTFILKDPAARDAAVVYRATDPGAAARTDGWSARSQADIVADSLTLSSEGAGNALESATVSGTRATFIINMAGIGGALTDGPFQPNVQVNTSIAAKAAGEDEVMLASQTCRWEG